MPIMDGLTCARTIRDFEADGTIVRHVPIVAVTANARLEQIETAIAAGMDDVVSKPFRIRDLIPKIEELVSKKTPSRPRTLSSLTEMAEVVEVGARIGGLDIGKENNREGDVNK